MRKRILSIILAALMLILTIPITSLAADKTVYVSASGDDTNNGTESNPFATLDKAISEAGSDKTTIVLLSDINIDLTGAPGTGKYVISGQGTDITLNLNGKTISATKEESDTNPISIFLSNSDSTFTVTDTSSSQTGKITSNRYIRAFDNTGTLNINERNEAAGLQRRYSNDGKRGTAF